MIRVVSILDDGHAVTVGVLATSDLAQTVLESLRTNNPAGSYVLEDEESRAPLELLQTAERRYRHAQELADAARTARNDAVRAAIDAGCSQTAIAAATGLSRGRVGQIIGRSA